MLDYMIPAAVQSTHQEDVVLYSWLWKDPHVFIKYWIVIRLGVFQLPAYNLSVQPRIQLPAYNLSVPYRSNFLLTTWVFCLRWSNNPAAKWLINRLKLLLAIIDLPSNPKKIDHKGLQCILDTMITTIQLYAIAWRLQTMWYMIIFSHIPIIQSN